MSYTLALNTIKYEDVRSQVVEFLSNNSEFTGQFDFTASNMSLIIDTMAYVTTMMAYQISQTANNLFLDTTTLRKNAVSIAKTMGYRPKRSITSKITGIIKYIEPDTNINLNLYSNDTLVSNYVLVIPPYTKFISDGGYEYINTSPILLKPIDTSRDCRTLQANVTLYEGTIKNYTYLGNGNAFQTFTIPSKKVDESFFSLKVRDNTQQVNSGIEWKEVKGSFNLLQKDSYFVEEDLNSEGYVRVVFGDSDITNYPLNTQIVDIQYLETNADKANSSSIVSIDYTSFIQGMQTPSMGVNEYITTTLSGFDKTKFTTSLNKSFGGTPIETLEIIKERAAKAFATVSRAVTQNDYKTLLTNTGEMLKSNVIGGDSLYPENTQKLGNIYFTGIPNVDLYSDFYSLPQIYLTKDVESRILNEFDGYRIISTRLSFIKPTYINLDITPSIEIKENLSSIDINTIKTNTNKTLNTLAKSYNDFNPTFRASKINGVLSDISGIISSTFSCQYSFALSKESFYEDNTITNFLNLPIIPKTRNSLGTVTEYTNFIRTNKQQAEFLGTTSPLPISDRTIFGEIYNFNNKRYIYNEDISIDSIIDTCDIMIDGTNVFFDLFRFEADYNNNQIFNYKQFLINGIVSTLSATPFTPVVSNGYTYDDYQIIINGSIIGNIKRTKNREYGYKGYIENESQITSNINGSFYRVSKNMSVSGSDKAFNSLSVDDVIMYDSTHVKPWIKCNKTSDVSASSNQVLINNAIENGLYVIANGTSGNFNGKTPTVSGGDVIIHNSTLPTHWGKVNYKNETLYNFDASTTIVKEVIPYEIKRLTMLDNGSTTFNGRSNTFFDEDLIWYNPSATEEIDRWTYICNTSVSGSILQLEVVDAIGTLEIFDYDPLTGLQIGTAYRVINEGNFTDSSWRINWVGDQTAFQGDVLLYIGNGIWNLWQMSVSDFNINGNVVSELPLKLTHGDVFTVSVSGNFTTLPNTYQVNDKIVYTGSNTWIPYVLSAPVSGLNPSSYLNLPEHFTIGDYFRVSEDGDFNKSNLISPLNDTFIVGDYVIYNGTTYTKLNEYTFEYISLVGDGSVTTKNTLNSLGFNSIFTYKFNPDTRYFSMIFNDIFHGAKLGSFRYSGTPSSTISLYDVGRLTFEQYITSKYNDSTIVSTVNPRQLFDDMTINKIKFLPKNKADVNNVSTTEVETNFSTNFNTFLVMSVKDTLVQ